jgi:hypothetical protein
LEKEDVEDKVQTEGTKVEEGGDESPILQTGLVTIVKTKESDCAYLALVEDCPVAVE